MRTNYAAQLPELPDGSLWEFRVGRELEVAQENSDLGFQTSGIGAHLVMVRVAPLGFCQLDPNINSWITCLPNVLLSHMAATNSPGDWIYIGWKKSYSVAYHWKSEIQMKYYNLLPPRSKSVLIPDFEYGFAQTETSAHDPKHEIYVKYNPARVQVAPVPEQEPELEPVVET